MNVEKTVDFLLKLNPSGLWGGRAMGAPLAGSGVDLSAGSSPISVRDGVHDLINDLPNLFGLGTHNLGRNRDVGEQLKVLLGPTP
jgi:hypothetical protein